MKNINITVGSLIGENTNMFSSGQSMDEAKSFIDNLNDALMSILNDTNNMA